MFADSFRGDAGQSRDDIFRAAAVWEAEKEFAKLKLENAQILHSVSDAPVIFDTEEKSAATKHMEGSAHSSS